MANNTLAPPQRKPRVGGGPRKRSSLSRHLYRPDGTDPLVGMSFDPKKPKQNSITDFYDELGYEWRPPRKQESGGFVAILFVLAFIAFMIWH